MLNFLWIVHSHSLTRALSHTYTHTDRQTLALNLAFNLVWRSIDRGNSLLSVCVCLCSQYRSRTLFLPPALCLSFVISHSSCEFASFGVCFVSVCLLFSFQALLHAYCCCWITLLCFAFRLTIIISCDSLSIAVVVVVQLIAVHLLRVRCISTVCFV